MIVMIGMLVLVILGFHDRITTLHRLEKEAEEFGEVVAQLTATSAVLEAQITFAASDAAVEKWAYEEGRMVREGDHPIAPIPSAETTPEPDILQAPAPETYENWEYWKFLFFGSNP